MKIVVVDYEVGNQRSILNTLLKLHNNVLLSSSSAALATADKLVLPGVGHFSTAIANIKKSHLWESLQEHAIIKKKPILGICLGMQIMADSSEEYEGETGLAWIPGKVKKMATNNALRYKIPHIGWATIEQCQPHALLDDLDAQLPYYFTHSFSFHPNDISHILCTSRYENTFVSGIVKENLMGLQFHPEKSHKYGQKLLRNFLEL